MDEKKFRQYLNYAFFAIGIFMVIYGIVAGRYLTLVFGLLICAFPVYRIYSALKYKKLQSRGNTGKDWRTSMR